MRHLRAACLAAAAAALTSASASSARGGEIALEGQAGYRGLAFQDTARAFFDKTGGGTFGGAIRYDVWRGLFVSAGIRTFSANGERVFLASPSAPVQKLGFPLKLEITDIPLTVGYRIRRGKTVVPYVLAGAVITKYKESSEVAGETFGEDVSKTGFLGGAGVEVRLVGSGLVRVAAEGGYSGVSGAIGKAGVSRVYGESDIGGAYVVGKLVLAFRGR